MIEQVLGEIRDSIQEISDNKTSVDFSVESYNLIAWLGESLNRIADTLEKIEQKM